MPSVAFIGHFPFDYAERRANRCECKQFRSREEKFPAVAAKQPLKHRMQCDGVPRLHPTLQPRDGQDCTRREPFCQIQYTVDAETPHAFAAPHVQRAASSGFVSVTISSNRSSPILLFEQTTTLSCDCQVAS